MTMNELLETRLDGVKVAHKGSTKLESTGRGEGSPSYAINVKIDFTGWTVKQVLDMACRPLWISFQRPASKLSVDQYKALEGKTLLASEMGKSPRTTADPKLVVLTTFENWPIEEQQAYLAQLAEKMQKDSIIKAQDDVRNMD